jgi:protein O-mannosyl-transferase
MGATKNTRGTAAMALLLGAVTFATFWPVTGYEFIYFDDREYIATNPVVGDGLTWRGVGWAAGTSYAANWHPVTWLSHMLDVQLFGLRAGGHHLTSLLLHAANAVLLFLLLNRMTGALWRSAFVAALFALHPLHVESVAWVSERKDVLSTFFGLLAIGAYAFYGKAENRKQKARTSTQSQALRVTSTLRSATTEDGFHVSRFYLLCLLLYALSLMSKPMLITLPFLLLLLDYWPNQRFQLSTQHSTFETVLPFIRDKVPFLLFAVGSIVITFLAQRGGGAVVPLEEYPFGWRLMNAVMGYWGYLAKLVWPAGLNFLYLAHPWPVWQVLLAALALAGITALVLGLGRSRPYLLVGWLWYLVALVPVIGLVQVGNQSAADRYTYVPLIGCLIMLAWGSYGLLERRADARVFLAAAAVLALLGCVVATRLQLDHWRTGAAVFERAIQCDRNNFAAHYYLGNAWFEQGKFQAAEAEYRAALGIRPRYADARANLGLALSKQGKTEEALTNYLAALQLQPQHAEAHKNLGVLLAERGQFEAAAAHFTECLHLAPNDPVARADLGAALCSQQRYAEGAVHLAAALRLKPGEVGARQNLALALMQQGKAAEAVPHLERVVAQRPDAESHHTLALALVSLGRQPEAIGHFRAALGLQPDWAIALNNLAWILATHPQAELRNGTEAVRLAERACELTARKDPPLLATLAAAYAEAGRFPEAIATAREVRDLALAARQQEIAMAAEARLALYESGRPWREP